jgi:hypothetical protein
MFRPVVAIIRFYHSTHLRLFYTVPWRRVWWGDLNIKTLLEHSTAILGVWVNRVMIHKNITLYYQNKKQNKKHEGPVKYSSQGSLCLSPTPPIQLLHPNSAHQVRCAVCVCVCVCVCVWGAQRTGGTADAAQARHEVMNNTGSRGH